MFTSSSLRVSDKRARGELEQAPDKTLTPRSNEMHEPADNAGWIYSFFLLSRESIRPQLPMEHYLDYINDRPNCGSEKDKLRIAFSFLLMRDNQDVKMHKMLTMKCTNHQWLILDPVLLLSMRPESKRI